jgi:predicted GNAT family acetyltransferase
MGSDSDSPEVRDNSAESRYEVAIEGQLAVLEYALEGDHITLIHTAVPEALAGHGIAGRLAKAALDDARARGLAVLPRCPYVAAYIRRHPEYADLVPASSRGLLGRPE